MDGTIEVKRTALPTTFVFLLFPDGRLPSPRWYWRFIAGSAALGILFYTLGIALHPGPVEELGVMELNPLGIEALAPFLNIIVMLTAPLLAIGFLGAIAALIIRYRRSIGVEREQMKWLVYASAFVVVGLVFSSFFGMSRPILGWYTIILQRIYPPSRQRWKWPLIASPRKG